MSLRGKRAVIIGGTSGIGFAIAEALLNEHAEVLVVSSRKENVEAAVKRLSDGVRGFAVDVRKEDEIKHFFDRLGAFDHLVFTAGDWAAMAGGALADVDIEKSGAGLVSRYFGGPTAVQNAYKT